MGANKIMNVLLVNPRTPDGCGKSYYLPLGLLYLASAGEKAGCNCQLLDFNTYIPYTKENPDGYCKQILEEKILQFQPDVILLGCLFSGQFQQVVDLSIVIKRISPNITTVLGGIHATSYPSEILSNCNDIDFIVIGEGEETLQQLLFKLINGESKFQYLDGLAFRDEA